MVEAPILPLVLSILLPPLAVFLQFGLGRWFWVDVVLTIFAWLPGVLYALFLILGSSASRRASA